MSGFLTVLLGAISMMILGYLWYSRFLFGKQWIRLSGWTEEDMKNNNQGNMAPRWITQVVLAIIEAWVLYYFFSLLNITAFGQAVQFSFFAWLGLMVPILYGEVLWNKRPFALFTINSLYHLAGLILISSIYILIS